VITRRRALFGLLAAPAIIRVADLMPVKPLIEVRSSVVYKPVTRTAFKPVYYQEFILPPTLSVGDVVRYENAYFFVKSTA
jgi:hypothetical protein